MSDNVNNPKHYTSHPSGVECIQITRHMSFNLGNVIKYLWRADEKGAALEDLKKARWYLDDEINRREGAEKSRPESAFTTEQLDADGWIHWVGGECPVPPESQVEVSFRNGQSFTYLHAMSLRWKHRDDFSDIIAYRVIKK